MSKSTHTYLLDPLLTKAQYLEAAGCKCIYCGSDDIEGSSLQVDGNSTWQEVTCNSCGSDWRDVYTLSDVELLDEDGNFSSLLE